MANPQVSVVIPTLDEAMHLGQLLGDLQKQTLSTEIIVADGGSDDETVAVAVDAGATIVSAPRGRGAQMNAGRDVASARWLLFLHADTRIDDPGLLARAVTAIEERTSVRGDRRVAGHFRLHFRGTESMETFRYLEAKTELNRKHTTNGDQGLLIAASWFDELGGFDEQMPFLEDQRLGVRIHERGEWMTLPGTIETSARRFVAEGFGNRYFVMAVIMAVWQSGAHEFFELAPDVYPKQSETTELELMGVFEAIWMTMDRIGLRRSVDAWLQVGRFTRENAWQLFFLADVLLDDEFDGARPFLATYDREIARRLDHPAIDAVVAAGAFTLISLVLPGWFGFTRRTVRRLPWRG